MPFSRRRLRDDDPAELNFLVANFLEDRIADGDITAILSAAAYVAPVRPARPKKNKAWESHWDMATRRLRDAQLNIVQRLAG